MTVLPLESASEPAVVVRHAAVARRLRLIVSGLRGQPHVANRLEAELRSPDLGVEEVRADWRSGRLLLRYRADAPLLERLRELPDRPESGTRSSASPMPVSLGALTGIGFIGIGALEIYRTFTLSGTETRAESDDEPAEAAADDLGDAPLEE